MASVTLDTEFPRVLDVERDGDSVQLWDCEEGLPPVLLAIPAHAVPGLIAALAEFVR